MIKLTKKILFDTIFFKGFTYEEIRMFLQKNHGIEISITTLKRRIKAYGLRRREPDYDVNEPGILNR
jgi:hypothetical protein